MTNTEKAAARPWENNLDSYAISELKGILNSIYALHDHAIEVYHVEASVEQSIIDRLVKVIKSAQ